jgi:hypothetical protein
MSWGWSIATLVVIVAITVFIDWLKKPRSARDSSRGHGSRAPHPAARIVEMPGGHVRLIDLRSLPNEDLRLLQLGLVQQQLSLERTVPVQIWVVDSTTARGWSQLDPIGRLIGLQRLRDPRNARGQNFLYIAGGKLREHELAALMEANIDIVESTHEIGEGSARSIDEFLEPVTPWHPSDDDRPIADSTVIKTGPFEGELVHVIDRHAFIDLRRAAPGAISTGVAFDRIEKALAALRTMPIKRVTWIAAPWVLELLDAKKTALIERLASGMFASIDQGLAVYSAHGEPVPRHPLMSRFNPLGDRSVLDRLHDTYFAAARKRPSL